VLLLAAVPCAGGVALEFPPPHPVSANATIAAVNAAWIDLFMIHPSEERVPRCLYACGNGSPYVFERTVPVGAGVGPIALGTMENRA
jgi:hypothetical protein